MVEQGAAGTVHLPANRLMVLRGKRIEVFSNGAESTMRRQNGEGGRGKRMIRKEETEVEEWLRDKSGSNKGFDRSRRREFLIVP